jgi:hypothetical protein
MYSNECAHLQETIIPLKEQEDEEWEHWCLGLRLVRSRPLSESERDVLGREARRKRMYCLLWLLTPILFLAMLIAVLKLDPGHGQPLGSVVVILMTAMLIGIAVVTLATFEGVLRGLRMQRDIRKGYALRFEGSLPPADQVVAAHPARLGRDTGRELLQVASTSAAWPSGPRLSITSRSRSRVDSTATLATATLRGFEKPLWPANRSAVSNRNCCQSRRFRGRLTTDQLHGVMLYVCGTPPIEHDSGAKSSATVCRLNFHRLEPRISDYQTVFTDPPHWRRKHGPLCRIRNSLRQ